MKNNKAFTLILLFIVVLFIGILSAVALPQYKLATVKARLATIRPLLASIKQAEEAYYLANEEYTNQWDLLDIDLSACPNTYSVSTADVRECNKHFLVDPIESEQKLNIRASYCPNARRGTTKDWTYCRAEDDFLFEVWLTHSAYPNKITCTGKTNLGKALCNSLGL